MHEPRYSKEEFARRGDELYEREVLPRLRPEDAGKYALIDIETGDFEIDRDELAASDRLLARKPDAQVWFRRVGSRYARRFGHAARRWRCPERQPAPLPAY
jgi:hypothetical protein